MKMKKILLQVICTSVSVHLFTTTTAKAVVVKAIAVNNRPISLNFQAIE
jgi:hypothetical protein